MPYKGRRKNPLVRFTAAKLRIFKRLRKHLRGHSPIFNTYSTARQASARRLASKVFHTSFSLPTISAQSATLLLPKGVAAPPSPASPAVFHTYPGGTRQRQNRTNHKIKSLTFQGGHFGGTFRQLSHFYERLCKARAEAKFAWIMPSRSQRCIYIKLLFPQIAYLFAHEFHEFTRIFMSCVC